MARAMTWAIRVTFADGHTAFVRVGGVIGRGSIWTFYSHAQAEAAAAEFRQSVTPQDVVTVIERSHGRNTI